MSNTRLYCNSIMKKGMKLDVHKEQEGKLYKEKRLFVIPN